MSTRPGSSSGSRLRWGLVLALLVLLVGAGQAQAASLWWLSYDSGNSRVGHANADGTDPNASFVSGAYFSSGVASNGQYVFWGESGGKTGGAQGHVGRIGADGTGLNHDFITAGTFCGVFALASNATHVYWMASTCNSTGRFISRAMVDGSGTGPSLVGGDSICSIAIDATYLYWSHGPHIGRANLDGSAQNATWLDTGSGIMPCGLAVTASHIYWTVHRNGANTGTTIGRATIAGAGVNNSFITGATFNGNISTPSGLAADDAYVYWGNQDVNGSIGRATLAGGGATQSFVSAGGFRSPWIRLAPARPRRRSAPTGSTTTPTERPTTPGTRVAPRPPTTRRAPTRLRRRPRPRRLRHRRPISLVRADARGRKVVLRGLVGERFAGQPVEISVRYLRGGKRKPWPRCGRRPTASSRHASRDLRGGCSTWRAIRRRSVALARWS